MSVFDSIEKAIEDIKNGKIVMVSDDESRENECDLIAAAELATTATLNFMATHAKGLICLPSDESILNRLDLPQMVQNNTDNHCTAFTVSIDHISTTTGISAEERALTVRKFAQDSAKAEDFRRPGHMFPLKSKPMGVLERNGHTEATVDLCRLAGLKPCGLCCEIMKSDGTMARLEDAIEFKNKHNLTLVSIKDLIEYRKLHEVCIKKEVETKLSTRYGEFNICGYTDLKTGKEHVALYMGDINSQAPVLCRVHSECLTGDALGSLKCDCGQQYDAAMKAIAREGRGILLYMRQEGRDIGLVNKLKAYELQRQGLDTVEANLALGFPEDMRKYDTAAAILKDLGVSCIRLLTNNPDKISKLESCGIEISERVPVLVSYSPKAEKYMHTKQEKMGHLLNL